MIGHGISLSFHDILVSYRAKNLPFLTRVGTRADQTPGSGRCRRKIQAPNERCMITKGVNDLVTSSCDKSGTDHERLEYSQGLSSLRLYCDTLVEC